MEELIQYVRGSNGESPQRFYISPEMESFAKYKIIVVGGDGERCELPVHFDILATHSKMFMGATEFEDSNQEFVETESSLASVLAFLRTLYDRGYELKGLDIGVIKDVARFADKVDCKVVLDMLDSIEVVTSTLGGNISDCLTIALDYQLQRVKVWAYGRVLPSTRDFSSVDDAVKFIRGIGDNPEALRIAFLQSVVRSPAHLPMFKTGGHLSIAEAEKLLSKTPGDIPRALTGKRFALWFDVPTKTTPSVKYYHEDTRQGDATELEKRYKVRTKSMVTNYMSLNKSKYGLEVFIHCVLALDYKCVFYIYHIRKRNAVRLPNSFECTCTLHEWDGEDSETETFTVNGNSRSNYVVFQVPAYQFVDEMGSFLLTLDFPAPGEQAQEQAQAQEQGEEIELIESGSDSESD